MSHVRHANVTIVIIDIVLMFQNLLLKEIGDMKQAVDFIESHVDSQQKELWNDLVDYSIKNPNYLSGLLDYLGICNLDAVGVVSSVPNAVPIPDLRQKIIRIIRHYHFQVFYNTSPDNIVCITQGPGVSFRFWPLVQI